MKKIKSSHVVVLGSGPSIKKYWNKINIFLKTNNVITFGCNNIMDFLVPDYHFWGSGKRWAEFGHKVDPSTVVVTSHLFSKKVIREKWKGKYKTFKNIERQWKPGSDDKTSKAYKRCDVRYKNGVMRGCVQNISTWAIFYAYVKGASKISVVGNDGYTLYPENKIDSQHCYGSGKTSGFIYRYSKKRDWDKYKTLRLLYAYGKKKFGFGFEMITPTIFDKFYNFKVLNIASDINSIKWKEPKGKLADDLYFSQKAKNRKL